MAVWPIRLFGDPVLHAPAEHVTTFDKELRGVIKGMMRTLDHVPGRAGVAAPQVGLPLRVIVYDGGDRRGHLVNPTLELSGQRQHGDEGCLSAPGLWVPLVRAYAVEARGVDARGQPVRVTARGLLARCLQHEADHLDGVTFIDRLGASRERLAA